MIARESRSFQPALSPIDLEGSGPLVSTRTVLKIKFQRAAMEVSWTKKKLIHRLRRISYLLTDSVITWMKVGRHPRVSLQQKSLPYKIWCLNVCHYPCTEWSLRRLDINYQIIIYNLKIIIGNFKVYMM